MPAPNPVRKSDSSKWAILVLPLAFLAIGGAGCANATQSNSSPSGNVITVNLSFCSDPGPNCAPAGSFSIASLRDLSIVVRWSNVPAGTHTQRLDILEPDGGLYQTVNTGFAVAPSNGSATTTQPIPVAGSWISQRSLSGNWTVQVSLDDQPVGSQVVRLDP